MTDNVSVEDPQPKNHSGKSQRKMTDDFVEERKCLSKSAEKELFG